MKSIGKLTATSFCIFTFSVVLFLVSLASPNLAELINFEICQRVRNILGIATSTFDFSVFELMVFVSPVLIFLMLRYIARGKEDVVMRFLRTLSVVLIFPTLYIFTVGISYIQPSYFDSYNKSVTDEALFLAVNSVIDTVNSESRLLSDEPSFDEMCPQVEAAFKKTFLKADLKLPKPKGLLSSKLVSYTGALAVYSFPTGEINVNTNAPTYTIPYTLAHETTHYFGVAHESDANFLSYLILSRSDSPYARYSASVSVLEYMLADLKRVNVSLYSECFEKLSERAASDISQGINYARKYNFTRISQKFDKLNGAHSDIWDKNQIHSYGAVSVYVTNYLNSA
ncbi:MAG: DUF3810 domain-containing protein [Ruminococcaceae bacterium]|nr:DUF3810 domain-containing protein [Oscillospiraceae bacterium]